MNTAQRQVLFVDDDAGFLEAVKALLIEASGGRWEIVTAQNHGQALEAMQKQRMDLVVLDISMPVMDGFQFLRLMNRTYPGQQVVMLTGEVTEEKNRTCLENGVLLLLQKPVTPEGFKGVFTPLNALLEAQPQAGFRGMMRQVGLPEVLQMECLGKKSSTLEIFTGKLKGRIFICDGAIVHAEAGAVEGEAALYGLLGLKGGEFNLRTYTEPARRTIDGPWEFLLMEAARLTDEGTQFLDAEAARASEISPTVTKTSGGTEFTVAPAQPALMAEDPSTRFTAVPSGFDTAVVAARARSAAIQIKEIALCSGAGELLFEAECAGLEGRLRLMEQVEQQATQIGKLINAGRFDRLEIEFPGGRVVCDIHTDRRLFVRSEGA